jgi:DNA-binding beta-propeller fold protein YncE
VNGEICDASDTSGCDQAPATITAGNPAQPGGLNPWGIAVDDATDTVYVALKANGDYAGTLAVINGASCNGTDTTGCGQLPPTVPAGFGVNDVAIDAATGNVYATNNEDASVSVIDGAICNSRVSSGCDLVPSKLAAGNGPGEIAVDPAAGTAYIALDLGGVSVVPLVP